MGSTIFSTFLELGNVNVPFTRFYGSDTVICESISQYNDRAVPTDDAAENGSGRNESVGNGNATRRCGTNEGPTSPNCRRDATLGCAKHNDACQPADDGTPLDGNGSQPDGPHGHGSTEHDAAAQHARKDQCATGPLHDQPGLQHDAPHAATPAQTAHESCRHSNRTTGDGWWNAPHESAHVSPPLHAYTDGTQHGGSWADDASAADGDRRLPSEQHGRATARHHAHHRTASNADSGTANSAGTACVINATGVTSTSTTTSPAAATDAADERRCVSGPSSAAA